MSKNEELPDEGWFRFPPKVGPSSESTVIFVGIHPSLEPHGYREVGVEPVNDTASGVRR
jgi:hypothetical protein